MKKRASAVPDSQKSSKITKVSQKHNGNVDDNDSISGDDMCYYSDVSEPEVEESGDSPEEMARVLRLQNQWCAERALEYYNKKNHANYELVEATISTAFDVPPWFHCNFKAKLKTTPPSDEDSHTKLFFAELYHRSPPKPLAVTRCCIIKGKTVDCQLCGSSQVKHPNCRLRATPNPIYTCDYPLRSRPYMCRGIKLSQL